MYTRRFVWFVRPEIWSHPLKYYKMGCCIERMLFVVNSEGGFVSWREILYHCVKFWLILFLYKLQWWVSRNFFVLVKIKLCLNVLWHVVGFLFWACQVLKAIQYGDSVLFQEHPELLDSIVRVYFHSSSKKYNRMECWGPLKDAMEVILGSTEMSNFTFFLTWD